MLRDPSPHAQAVATRGIMIDAYGSTLRTKSIRKKCKSPQVISPHDPPTSSISITQAMMNRRALTKRRKDKERRPP